MNLILYHSSLFCSSITLIFILNTPFIILKNNIFIILLILLGLISSILNHKYTYHIIKYLDRCIIFSCFIYYCFYLSSILLKYFLYLSVIFYFLSKYFNICLFHIYSHLLVTIINIKIIMDLNNYESS